MNIDDLTLGQIKQIQSMSNSQVTDEYPVGENVIVRTVTMIYTGKLKKVTDRNLILIECSWIPETDRYMNFIEEGSVKECEPYPSDLDVYINKGALIDMCILRAILPRTQK